MTSEPVMYVCPTCGPMNVMWAGRVVSRLCDRCRATKGCICCPMHQVEDPDTLRKQLAFTAWKNAGPDAPWRD